jgi:hypothetical protein
MDFSGKTRRLNAMRCCLAASAVAVGGARASAQTAATATNFRREQQPIQVEPKNVRFSNYLHDLNSPGALIGVVGGGVLEHLRQKPRPGNGEAGGLGQVILSRAGAHAVDVSVRHSLAALMQRSTDDRYQFCECHGLVPRVGHALVETFTDRRADGHRALSFPRFAGAYAGNFAQAAWDPGRHNPGNVAVGTTLSFGISALFNVGRELSGLGR